MPLPEIVTLEEVDLFLRLGGDVSEEPLLRILIAAATEAVLAFTDAFDPTEDPPARIKLAVLAHIAQAFDNREDSAGVPSTVLNMVRPFRSIDL